MTSRPVFLCAVVVVVLPLLVSGFTCQSDMDCHLNGVCKSGTCNCDPIWGSDDCSLVQFKENAIEYLNNGFGQSATKNISTWGGNVLRDDDGIYHMYVAEMAGGCSLIHWGGASQVSHAVSKTPDGPYQFKDVAIPVWSHNPRAVKWTNSSGSTMYLLFHIGGGTGKRPPSCNGTSVLLPPLTSPASGAGSNVHMATSLDGPWTPVIGSGIPTSCNNPAPLQLRNGTWLLVCQETVVMRSEGTSPFGPYVEVSRIPVSTEGADLHWEDPMLYEDPRGGIHCLFHVYSMKEPCGACDGHVVSGHAFSSDGLKWTSAAGEPFDNTYTITNGSTITVSTRERPVFLLNSSGVPTHLINGVSAVATCPPHHASRCKEVLPGAWTMTLVAPLVTAE